MKKRKKIAKKQKRAQQMVNAHLCQDQKTGVPVIVLVDHKGSPSVNPPTVKMGYSDSASGPFTKDEGRYGCLVKTAAATPVQLDPSVIDLGNVAKARLRMKT